MRTYLREPMGIHLKYAWEKKINWAMVGREIGLISRGYFAKKYGKDSTFGYNT